MNVRELNFPGTNLFNIYQYLIIFFIASLRISSFLISAPFFSLGGIPLQVRIVASISLTVFLFPVIKVPVIQLIGGFNLFVLQGMAGKDMGFIAKSAFPLFLLMVLATIILIIFPEIAMWLPNQMIKNIN